MRTSAHRNRSLRYLQIAALVLALLELRPAPGQASPLPPAPLALTVQAPSEVVAQTPFAVQVTLAGDTNPPDGLLATLTLLDDSTVPMLLDGSPQAHLVNGTAVFPAVLVQAHAGAERSIRLIAVAIAGTQTISGLSNPILVHAAPQPVIGGVTFGGIGVDTIMDHGKLIVFKPLDAMPAKQAGVQAGDQIVAVDGKPIDGLTLDGTSNLLRGPVGTVVVITVRHKSSDQTQVISIQRAAMSEPPVAFSSIPNQPNEGLFQISLAVHDTNGRPVPGARVTVHLDPAYSSAHALFFTMKVALRNASGASVDALTAVTAEDGTASLWVRLGSNITPYRSRLTATVQLGQQSVGPFQSNVFTVYDPSN